MYIIMSLKPIWELFSIILNWALIIVPILFICCIGAIAFHHYIIDKDSDDIGKKVCYKKRMKNSVAYFLPILTLLAIIRIVLHGFIGL